MGVLCSEYGDRYEGKHPFTNNNNNNNSNNNNMVHILARPWLVRLEGGMGRKIIKSAP